MPGSQPAFDGDPLFGGQPRLPRNGAVAAQHPAANVTGPDQLPATSGSTSPAALAAAVPVADASTLRIAPAPAVLTSAPHDGDPWQPPTPSSGVTLQQPQPLVGPPPRPIDAVAAPTVAGPIAVPADPPAGADAFGQLQQELTQRGVLFQSLEGPDDHGVWSFTCGVPKRGDPDSDHRIEVSAVGDHGLAAIRAAIDKIDRDAP